MTDAPPPAVPPAGNPHAKSRVLVAVLGSIGPGLGHAFVGHPVRGAAWALGPAVVLLVLTRALPSSMPVAALVGVLAGAALVGYFASLIDAALLSPARHRAMSVPGMVALVIAPLFVSVGVAMVVRGTVLQAFKVPSGAMLPNILVGDHLFVDMRVRPSSVRRGDVIVFKYPERPSQDFIKRVIARPGDTLEVRGGHPVINGWEVPSCRVGTWTYRDDSEGASHEGDLFIEFLEASSYLVFFDRAAASTEVQGPFHASRGEWWVMGDNRHNSFDSRQWFGGKGGGVPDANIRGRAGLVWLSDTPGRAGTDLGGPPRGASPDLAVAVARCMAERPPLDRTTPPSR